MNNSEVEKIDWLKNVLAVATILILAGIYYFLIDKGFQFSLKELILQVIPDLIAALIIVLTVYYIFIRKGISSEEKLRNSLEKVVRKSINNNTFDNEKDSLQDFDIEEVIDNTKKLLIIGYSCRFFISALQKELEEGLKNKMDLKLLIITTNSDASRLMMNYDSFEELEVDIEITERKLSELNTNISKSSGRKKVGNIEYRSMNWIPSCSVIIFQSKDGKNGVLKLKVYPINHKTTLSKVATHKIIYQNKEKELYEYFCNQYYELWNKGKIEEIKLRTVQH